MGDVPVSEIERCKNSSERNSQRIADRRVWSRPCACLQRRGNVSGSLAPAIGVAVKVGVTAGERAGGEGDTTVRTTFAADV